MSDLPINGLDLAVGIVLLVSALLALWRGFVQEILSIAAWVGAVLGALYGLKYVQPTARKLIPLDWAADAVAMAVVFLGILFTLSIAINLLARTVQKSALNPLDRSLGFVFGLVRGAVILCVGMIISDWLITPQGRPDWMREAKTLPLMEDGASALKRLLPATFQQADDAAKDAAAKLNEALETKRTLEMLTAPVPRAAGDKAGAETPRPSIDEIGRKVEELLQNTTGTPPAPAPDAKSGGAK